LKAYTQVVVVHLVELGTGVQQTDVAGDGEQEIIVEWRQLRKLVFQKLGRALCALTFLLNPRLNSLGKDFVGQLT
jgi:hypothetical protein